MGTLWKRFYYSSKKAEAMKYCVRTIRKELPSLITTLDNMYDSTGDAEAYGVSLVLSFFTQYFS